MIYYKKYLPTVLTCILMLVFHLPTSVFAQDITGVWKGTISTTDKELPYELAITENDGKFSGYSYIRFFVNGKEMSAVKSIKVKNDNGHVTVTDDDLIYDNFSQQAARDVKQTCDLELKTTGELITMNGTFKTKPTRQFRVLSGKISIQKVDTTTETTLLPTLDSLQLKKDLSFLHPKQNIFAAVQTKPSERTDLRNTIAKDSSGAMAKNTVVQSSGVTRKIITEPVLEEKTAPVVALPIAAAPVKKQPVISSPVVITKPVVPKPIAPKPVAPKPSAPVVTAPVVAVATPKAPPAVVRTTITGPDFTASLAKRSIETIKTLEIKTDSLTLTLYDNGEVDGDTVSVIMNGKMLMAKQGLSTNAITKTIYITPDMGDSIQLVMYAENLGSLPPNTGLLIIKDGSERYEIRFSGDLTKNAGITLRRKKL